MLLFRHQRAALIPVCLREQVYWLVWAFNQACTKDFPETKLVSLLRALRVEENAVQ